jgi:outer membrane protein assembly factor BamB
VISEMICASHGCLLMLGLAVILCGGVASAQVGSSTTAKTATVQTTTLVTVRWGARPGVSRYRLQLANDADFTDIAFDRIVYGHEYRVADLAPGKYFWRVASLDGRLGTFSSAGVIEVAPSIASAPTPSQPPTSPTVRNQPSAVATQRGWYAAIPNISRPILAHLRSPTSLEIVAMTTDARVIALDSSNGVALWVHRWDALKTGTTLLPLTIRTRGGVDNVLVFAGTVGSLLDGKTGRELWRTKIPGGASTAVAAGAKVFVIDNSLAKLFIIDGNAGNLLSEVRLPRRAVGAPVVNDRLSPRTVMVALEDGRLQIFDDGGKLIRAGDAAGVAMTAPLIVRTLRGELVLVGTRNGLTALNADDLRPLGRVTLKDDSPRGSLFAQDLDADGTPEVVMFTERGRVVVVKSDEGKIVWEGDAKRAEAAAFADINGDHVLDLLMAGREGFAFALSGRDGTMIWKDEPPAGLVTNHAPAATQRSALVVSSPSGVLFIATDPARSGLRALEFPKGSGPRN